MEGKINGANEQFIEFLFKRITRIVDDIGDEVENYSKIEDLEDYINTLKSLIKNEVLETQ